MELKNKIDLIKKTVNHEAAEKVPVIGLYEFWAIGYAGETYGGQLDNLPVQKKIMKKVMGDFTFDGVFEVGNSWPFSVHSTLGTHSYFISEDKVSLQHSEYALMSDPEEYDSLIKDFMGYTYNELFLRKFPNINGDEKSVHETMKKAMLQLLGWYDELEACGKYAEEECNTPCIVFDWCVEPMDMIFDYYRGFKGTMTDVRRNPEKIAALADIIADYEIKMYDASGSFTGAEYPYFFIPIHCPTYLNPKQFEKLYWPSFKKMADYYDKKQTRVMAYWEGDCRHVYDHISQLPPNRYISVLEKTDFALAKKSIGKNTAILGGISTEMLKNESVEKCIDETKRIFDICAPGGGFMFSTDKLLITTNDVNSDTYMKVNEFAYEYGKF